MITVYYISVVSENGAVVKVVDSQPCGWGSIPSTNCSFFHSLVNQGFRTVSYVFHVYHVKHLVPLH